MVTGTMYNKNEGSSIGVNHAALKGIYQECVDNFIAYHLYFDRLSILCDMLRLHGFKRWFEYLSLAYYTKCKGLIRHGIDCFSFTVIPGLGKSETMLGFIKFEESDPNKIDSTYRTNMLKEILSEIKSIEWSLYNYIAKVIPQVSQQYPTEVVNLTNLAKCVNKNIYEINRITGHYNALQWNGALIEHEQQCMHDFWEEELKKEFNVCYC